VDVTPAPAKPKSRKPKTAGPLIIVKRDEQEFSDWIATEAGFLTSFASYGDKELKLEPYQNSFLNSKHSYRSVEKSRQVGYSFVFALESLARSHLRGQHVSVFVSYNLADAKEKIAYLSQLHEELPLEYAKKKITDSKLEIAFQSNSASGSHRQISRVISNPSKAPRGKSGDIYLDELAHCANDREIYKGSSALIIRSGGQLTICSSPLGRRGVFWEVARQELRAYSSYWRQAVPWWLCGFMCVDIRTASREAPKMSTVERVERFGTQAIKDQFGSLLLEDFQQEYECVYSDETLTFFPYELIMPCTDGEHELYEALEDVRENCNGRLVGGFDVGRRKDLSELVIFEESKTMKTMVYRKSFDRVPFADQKVELQAVCNVLPMARLSIDNNGIGMNLAEDLEREFPGVVVREDFTNASKEVWCTDFKVGLQKKMTKLPRLRDLVAQIHSIKKSVTPAGRVTFDTERDSKGHADLFWACALACRKERGEQVREVAVRVRVIG
jgi:phage FluMu gp28-like protein